jgi:hypothetical protein
LRVILTVPSRISSDCLWLAVLASDIDDHACRRRCSQTPNNGETLPMISLSGFASGTIWLGKSDAFSAHVSRARPPDPGCRQPLRAAIYKGTRLILVKSTWR